MISERHQSVGNVVTAQTRLKDGDDLRSSLAGRVDQGSKLAANFVGDVLESLAFCGLPLNPIDLFTGE